MTVNQQLHDAAIGHAVNLQHYANGVVRRVIALLNRVDADLSHALTEALDNLPASSFTVERLEALLGSLRVLNAQAYASVGQALTQEMRDLATYEAGYQGRLFEAAIPSQVRATVGLAAVNVEQVYAAAMARPFQGRLLKEWAQSLEADRMARIRDAIRIGYVEQQTISQIVARVRGTRTKAYADGLIDIDRRNAEAVVRTAVSHTAGFVRDEFFQANDDLIKSVEWSATLDTRTSEGCRIRDGKRYTTDHKPVGHSIPWLGGPGRLHWQCRSVGLPITKSWRELGIDIDEMPASTRASMDGQIPADTTFAGWIKRQSAARQDEVLGAARAKMMRDGASLDRFYNDKGRFLSLDELSKRDGAGLP